MIKSEKRILSGILSLMLVCSVFAGIPASAKSVKNPGKVKILSVKQTSAKSVRVTWKKAKGADGYNVYQKINNKKFKVIKKIKLTKKNRRTKIFKADIKKLAMKKMYGFKVRAWKKSGKKVRFGKYSSVKKIILKGKSAKIQNPKKPQTPGETPKPKMIAEWNIGSDIENGAEYDEASAKDTVKATLYNDGHLVIKGKGNAQYGNFTQEKYMPWHKDYQSKIKKVTIEKGVAPKNISDWFRGCENLKTAPKIPASVKIMNNTFEKCKSLTGRLQVYIKSEGEHGHDVQTADCLKHAAINEGCSLKIDYVDEYVFNNLKETAINEDGTDNQKVSKGELLK